MHLSSLPEDEAVEVGSLVGALVGLGFDGEAGAEAGAQGRCRGGYRVSDGYISPLDLIGLGLLTAEEAAELHRVERRP